MVESVSQFQQNTPISSLIPYYSELLTTPSVLFAGYKLPHPLEPVVLIKIQTDGTQTPTQVLEAAIMSLIAMIGQLQDQFKREFSAHEVDPVGPEDAYGVVGVMGSGTQHTGGGWGSGRDYMDF